MLASVSLMSGHVYAGSLKKAVLAGGSRRFGSFPTESPEFAKREVLLVDAECRVTVSYRGCRKLSKKELWESSTNSQVSEHGRIRSRTRSHFKAVQCGSNVQSLEMEISGSEQLRQYLKKVYSAMGLHNHNPRQHITVTGEQVLMGMEGQWSLTWNMDGRFYERYEGPELHFEWAYDEELGPWCADAAGRVSSLDLDDREVCLLASWVRTGYWLTDEGQKQLSIHLEQQKSDSRDLILRLQLKKSKVVAYLAVDLGTWLPLRLSIKAFGSEDKWEFGDWQPILVTQGGCSIQFPRAVVHNPPAGGNDLYSLTGVKLENFDDDLEDREMGTGHLYVKPRTKLVPRLTWSYPKTHINDEISSSVTMIQAESGHYLVRPLVDGQDIGYFIVDTGASSLTIAPNKAEELGMYEFGEAYVTGVEGEVKCQFRRANSFQIGPLTITEPIFMEVPMAGVVRGVSSVAGICGYDLFFHCIVEMSCKRATLSLYDPLAYSSFIRPTEWQKMYFLENVPHVPATFNGNEAIFLLDTGAGGVDLIFHGRAAELYNLNKTLELAGTASVKGINTSGKGLQVQYGILDSLQVAGQSFRKVKALFPTVGSCGSLDFSEYTAGVLCGDLLENLILVLDYGQRRFAFVDRAGAGHSSRPIR
ncbi:unnamed protein product [Calypogeia fissa]